MSPRYVRFVALIASLGVFCWYFNPGRAQWTDALWLLAASLWVFEITGRSGRPLLGLPLSRTDLLPLVILLPVFAACWLPFYDNWRWASAGDSISWFRVAAGPARNGLDQSILSLRGVDGNFSLLQGLAFNALMFVFGPTLFWHRVGKLVVSCLSLAAMYLYFAVTLNRWMALAVAAATATDYVWLWFSYVSYAHIDSHIFYFGTLICATIIWRHPEHLGAWLLCGLIGGFALFFTQTAWSVVVLVGAGLALFALRTRRWVSLAVYAGSFLLVSLPVLLQFRSLLEMTTRQARSVYEWEYLARIFSAILTLPYTSNYTHIGVSGGFLRLPLAELYFGGIVLGLAACVPPLRRALRLPTVAALVVGLLFYDTVLMTVTNNGYGSPSTKRTYNLIPLQIFLALLPCYALYVWTSRWEWARRLAIGLTVAAMALAAAGSFQRIAYPSLGLYGDNSFDGLIELRQRFPERQVVFLTSRSYYREVLMPNGFFDEAYHLLDQLTLASDFTAVTVDAVCQQRSVFCTEPHMDREYLDPLMQQERRRLQPFELLNSKELICYECVPGGVVPAGEPRGTDTQ